MTRQQRTQERSIVRALPQVIPLELQEAPAVPSRRWSTTSRRSVFLRSYARSRRAYTFARQDAPGGRQAFATLAAPYARRALQLARETGDRIGALLARLAMLRANRMLGAAVSRIQAVETIVRAAKRAGDDAVLGRALTVLGEEFEAELSIDAACDCYQQAWRLLENHQLYAMALVPRRAFLQLKEQYIE
jgi:hypothetical protein